MTDLHRHDEHRWFRARLDAGSLGLLDEAEERRFDAHASGCAPCQAALDAHREHGLPELKTDGHIPARVLARWDRARQTLGGVPRRILEEHLEGCEECRDDLEFLGQEPTLGQEPGIVETHVGAPAPVSILRPARSAWRAGWRGPAPRPRWLDWAIGGLAGAALATVASVLVTLHVVAPEPNSSATIGAAPERSGDTRGAPAPVTPTPAPSITLGTIPPAARLKSPARGQASTGDLVRIGAEDHRVQVILPDLFLPESSRVWVRILGPDGRTLDEIHCPYAKLYHRRALLLEDRETPLAAGVYRIRVGFEGHSESAAPDLTLRLVREGAR